MKASEIAAEQKAIRATAERVRDVRGRVRGDAAFKARVARFVTARRAAGEPLGAIASALGIPQSSLLRWAAPAKAAPRFSRVRVTSGASESGVRAWTVHGPAGLRIEGLTVAEVAALWAELL